MKNIKDYLDRGEVESILAAASTQSERDYLIIRTMWRTGMRVSELVAMTPSDIEGVNRVINVVMAKGESSGECLSMARRLIVWQHIVQNMGPLPIAPYSL